MFAIRADRDYVLEVRCRIAVLFIFPFVEPARPSTAVLRVIHVFVAVAAFRRMLFPARACLRAGLRV